MLLNLTPELWALIVEVNDAINIQVKYITDSELYKQLDFWTIAENAGDCDDYALTKRHYLTEGGVPRDCLRLATCWTETDEYHAILIVDTSQGSFVLDNRYQNVMHYQDLIENGYKFDWIQDSGKLTWRKFRS